MSFSAYIIMLGGICAVMVLVELILPMSSVSKYIRGILAIFIVFAIISPIPSMLKKIKIDINSNGSAVLDETFLLELNDQKRKVLEEKIEADAKLKNYDVDVTISTILTGGEMKIIYASVFVNKFDGNKDEATISIKNIVKKYVFLEDDKISVLIGENT